jgi:hypothetical protein
MYSRSAESDLTRLTTPLLLPLFIGLSVLLAGTPTLAEEEKDPEGYRIKWKNGLKIERNDGYHKFSIGGRLFVDFFGTHGSDGVNIALETRSIPAGLPPNFWQIVDPGSSTEPASRFAQLASTHRERSLDG